MVVDVRLREHVGARRDHARQPLEGGPRMEHVTGEQIVGKGQVAELIDRQGYQVI